MYTAGRNQIQNGILTEANTEYKISLPEKVKKILIQARQYAPIKFCFTDGKSGTEYITLKPGVAYWEDDIRFVGDLYVQSPTAGTIVEVIAWYGGDFDK